MNKVRVKEFFTKLKTNKLIALVVVLIIAVSGVIFLVSRAAGFFAANEAETGTLSGSAKIVNDADAIGGKAVEFTVAATPPPPPPATCNLNATPSNFATQLNAATPGQTICLSSGNYGTWSGTNKAVTVKAASGATPQMQFNFGSGDSGFTLDGMSAMNGTVAGGAANITVKNSQFTGAVEIDESAGAGLVFDGNTHNNIRGDVVATRFLADGPVTVKNSRFEGGGADGLRVGGDGTRHTVNVFNNIFMNIIVDSDNHTDMLQIYGGNRGVIRGNLFKQTIAGETQVIGAYDGQKDILIEDNVFDVTGRDAGVELYSDDGSIVRHNTVVYRNCCGLITLSRKDDRVAGMNTQVYDNIATAINIEKGSTASRRDHNMVRNSAGAGDFVGIPVFVGGANPSTYEGYKLAAGSPGKGAASDGLDVGIRVP